MMIRAARPLCFLAAALMLVGCQSSSLSGRAVSGPVSLAVPAQPDDPRLKDPIGVEGVDIELRRTDAARTQGTLIAKTTTGADGRFSLKIDQPSDVRNQMIVTAAKPGYAPVRTTTLLGDRELLLVLRELKPN